MSLAFDSGAWRGLLAACVFLAAVHAYRKQSPYYAITWFGAGLLFGYLWLDRPRVLPELVLLPVLVFYVAAAVTKGLVEGYRGLRGNHFVHVLAAGVITGFVALPHLAVARALGFSQPPRAGGSVAGIDASWLGGVGSATVVMWMAAGALFYGAYKLIDHLGGRRPVPTAMLFAVQPFLVHLIDQVRDALG